jgi:hypothetical protein
MKMILRSCLVFSLLLFAPKLALAIPCATGTLAGITGTTCDIGDKTFNFQSFLSRGILDSQIAFTPNNSDPLAPGFRLSGIDGPISISTIGFNQAEVFSQITYTVSTIGGAPTILGTTIALNSPSATGSGTDGSGPEVVDAFNFMASGLLTARTPSSALPEVCISTPVSIPTGCVVGPPFPSTLTVTGSFATPVSSTDFGQVGFALNTSGTGSATFVSADYRFNQTAVPEPSTLLLVVSGLAGVAVLRRRIKA